MERRSLWEIRTIQLLVILAAAALLRFMLLGDKSLWFDEAFSVAWAQRTLQAIWAPGGPRPESHPPLYYTLLHYWMAWRGSSETAVRLPSAVMSVVNVGLLYSLGRRLLGSENRAAMLAAALLAVSPLPIWYAQEARMYVFVTGAGLLFAILLTVNSWWALPPLAATLTIGLYLDYTMPPLWAGISALGSVWWWQNGRPLRPLANWLIASFTAALMFRPWLVEFQKVLDSFYDIHLFEELNRATGLPIFQPWQYLLIMLAGSLLLIPATLLLQNLLRNDRSQRAAGILAVILLVVLTLLIPIPRLYGIKRLVLLFWPYGLLLVSWLMVQLPRARLLAGATLGISILASLFALLAVPKDDWRGAVAYINQNAASDAIVYFDPGWTGIMGSYYPLEREAFSVRSGLEGAPEAAEIWLIAQRFPEQEIPSSATEAALDARKRLQEAVPFYRLEVRRYRE